MEVGAAEGLTGGPVPYRWWPSPAPCAASAAEHAEQRLSPVADGSREAIHGNKLVVQLPGL